MKKILLILLILLILSSAAIAVFIAAFDANQFKPYLIESIEKNVGNPVALESVSLTWHNGIALALDGLSIHPGDPEKKSPAALSLERATASVSFLPLLQGKMQVGGVTLTHPKIQVLRNPEGTVKVLGINLDANRERKSGLSVPISFFIHSLKIEKGEVSYVDQMVVPAMRIPVEDISIQLKDVSWLSPLRIDAKASLFSFEQNLSLKSRFVFPTAGSEAAFENLHIETQLEDLDLNEMFENIPALKDSGLASPLRGKLRLEADVIPIDPDSLSDLKARFTISNGRLTFLQTGPLDNVRLNLNVEKNQMDVKEFSTDWGGGTLAGSANIAQWSTQPQSEIKLTLQNMSLEKLAPPTAKGAPHMQGWLDGNLQVRAQGSQATDLTQTAAGDGRITIKEPVLRNMNILREVLGKMSMIPGLSERLDQRLPETYKAKLQAADTVFAPIDLPFGISGGALNINTLNVASDSFALTGFAVYQLNGFLASQCMLTLDAPLSDAFMRSVEELRYLANPEGQLQIPLKIEGAADQIRVFPDLQYIGSRLAVAKTQEFIGDFLDKRIKRDQPQPGTSAPTDGTPSTGTSTSTSTGTSTAQSATTSTSQTPEDPYQALVGGLLQSIIDKNSD